MMFSRLPHQRSSIKKVSLILASILLLISISQTVHADQQVIISGDVFGDCIDSNANVSLLVYETGNPGNVIDTNWTLINASGENYDLSTSIELPAGDYDINTSISNSVCSPSASDYTMEINLNIPGGLQIPLSLSNRDFTMTTPFASSAPTNGTSRSNQTQFNWTDDYLLADTYTLEIATTNAFGGTIFHTEVGIATSASPGYKLTALQELPDDTYYWHVIVLNATGGIMDITTLMTYNVVSGEAIISNPSPAVNTWVGNSQGFSISTDSPATCRWDLAGVAFTSKDLFTTTGGTSHSTTLDLSDANGGSEGTNTIYVSCNSSITGLVSSSDYTHNLRRDTTAPSVNSVEVDGGAAWSTDTTLDFTWTGDDGTGSGISTYYYSTSNNGGTTSGTADLTSPGVLTGVSTQGNNYVYVWAADIVGNIGSADADNIIIDTQPPTFNSVSHTSISKYSAGIDMRVDAYITDTLGVAGLPTIRYQINNLSWTSWLNMSLTSPSRYTFTIPEGAGTNQTWFERSGETVYYEITATDTVGFTNQWLTGEEFIDNTSTPPTFEAISDRIIDEDISLSIYLNGSDADLEQLTFACNVTGASISRISDYQALLSWTPTNDFVGLNPFHCNVTDGVFYPSPNTFTIEVINVNDAPILEAVGNLYAQEYEFFNYTFNASDDDEDSLRYNSNESIFPLNSLTGKVAFTPFSTHRGTYDINISVSDGNGGLAYEEIEFTVGYCGDNICRDEYENCNICAIDCGICGETESKAIVLDEPRNCFGREVLMQAVKLVERATCEEEGAIINNMEVCGVLTSTSLQVLLEINEDGEDDAWEEVAQVSTDEDGYASFNPLENGDYKVAFVSDRDIYTKFEIEECDNVNLGGEDEDSDSTTPSDKEISLPPIIEEPTGIEDFESRWTFLSFALYFLVLPIILVVLIISSMGFVYRLEKSKQHENTYVKQVDKWLAEYQTEKKKVRGWMQKTPPFKEVLVYWDKSLVSTKKAWKFVKDLTVETWTMLILALGLKKKIKIPYLAQKKKASQKHLLLVALLKNVFPQKHADVLLDKVKQYNITSLYDLAALLISQGIKITLIDSHATDVNYLNTLISKGMTFRSRSPTRVDIESALQNGRAVVAIVNELGVNNTIIQSTIVLSGFDKYQFFYHNYDRQLKDVAVSKDQFMHSWKAAGFKGIILH